jgi:hypothetical protein
MHTASQSCLTSRIPTRSACTSTATRTCRDQRSTSAKVGSNSGRVPKSSSGLPSRHPMDVGVGGRLVVDHQPALAGAPQEHATVPAHTNPGVPDPHLDSTHSRFGDGPDGRRQIGSTPAGGGVGTARALCAPLQPAASSPAGRGPRLGSRSGTSLAQDRRAGASPQAQRVHGSLAKPIVRCRPVASGPGERNVAIGIVSSATAGRAKHSSASGPTPAC